MIEQRELITMSRQIGSMMEAGVDILRITRVLRAQTENPDILHGFDTLDHDLRMGQSLSDAMENVPTMFSPFAVSMIRQGEVRNDIAGAWHKLADFLQKEEEVAVTHGVATHVIPAHEAGAGTFAPANRAVAEAAGAPAIINADFVFDFQSVIARLFLLAAGLLLVLALAWTLIEFELIARRWQNGVLYGVAALWLAGAGLWLQRRSEDERAQKSVRRDSKEPADTDLDFDVKLGNEIAVPAASNSAASKTLAAGGANGSAPTKASQTSPAREATFE